MDAGEGEGDGEGDGDGEGKREDNLMDLITGYNSQKGGKKGGGDE